MEERPVETLMDKGNIYFPEAITDYARSYDFLHSAVAWGSAALFVGLTAVALYFSWRYRRTKANPIAAEQSDGNLKLELIWTIVPTILVMILFVWGARDYLRSKVMPSDAIEIQVIGQRWNWVFVYPEGFQVPGELVVPAGRNIKLLMNSRDVIHSFYLPNLRLKRDVLPNRYTTLVFNTASVGTYQVFCAEYCGDQHSSMWALLKVVPAEEYAVFATERAALVDISPLDLGTKLFVSYGCNACHSLDGSVLVGPSWLGLFGNERTFSDGSTAIANDDYLRSSIITPQGNIVKGFNNVMPSFGYLSEKEVIGLMTYIKTIQP